ncbi:MAG: hypothetical protein GXW99_02410 [Clostridiales bacterium]|nr:hypothetical protein [Clostridiales bacterium]
MKKIFLGILLILLDFHLEFSMGHLGLLPDFVGYYFLLHGLRELSTEGIFFKRAIPVARGVGIYSAVLWVLDLFGFATSGHWLYIFCDMVAIFLALYTTRLVVEGIGELEKGRVSDLHYRGLKIDWYIMAVFQTLSFSWVIYPSLAAICVLISAVDSLIFLSALYKSKRAVLAA